MFYGGLFSVPNSSSSKSLHRRCLLLIVKLAIERRHWNILCTEKANYQITLKRGTWWLEHWTWRTWSGRKWKRRPMLGPTELKRKIVEKLADELDSEIETYHAEVRKSCIARLGMV